MLKKSNKYNFFQFINNTGTQHIKLFFFFFILYLVFVLLTWVKGLSKHTIDVLSQLTVLLFAYSKYVILRAEK